MTNDDGREMINETNLRALIRSTRKEQRLSLQKVADLSSVGKSTIGNYETGKTGMSDRSLSRVVAALGIKKEQLGGRVLPRTEVKTTWNKEEVSFAIRIAIRLSRLTPVQLRAIEAMLDVFEAE